MILFTKYSNDRSRRTAISTQILEEDGVRKVRKSALYPEGNAHIEAMKTAHDALQQLFRETKFVPDRLLEISDAGKNGVCSADFAYLTGRTLSEQLSGMLPYHKENFLALFRKFMHELDSTADTTFVITDAFRSVFGTTGLAAELTALEKDALPAVSTADLDLITENVLLCGDEWQIIDYEWTFTFPVPVSFIKWRAVHYYLRGAANASGITEEELLKEAGIPRRCLTLFGRMEEAFQTWIAGETTPLWKLYPAISPGAVRIGEGSLASDSSAKQGNAVVYFNRGEGFSESDTSQLPIQNGILEAEIPVKEVLQLRIDPLEAPTAIVLESISANGSPLEREQLLSNGYTEDFETWYFTTSDPQLLLPSIPEGAETLRIRIRVLADAVSARAAADEVLSQQTEELHDLRQRITAAEGTVRVMTDAAKAIQQTKAVRAYKEARSALKKSDPFATIRPVLKNHEYVHLSIDRCAVEPDAVYVMGWFLDPEYPGAILRVLTEDGSDAPVRLRRVMRPDVNRALEMTDGRRVGFNIRIAYADLPKMPFYLHAETPRGVLTERIPLDPDPVRRRKERAAFRAAKAAAEANGDHTDAAGTAPEEYDIWAIDHEKTEEERNLERGAAFPYMPKLSFVVPLYRTPKVFLRELVDSVLGQTYPNIELCLADGSGDDRIGQYLQKHYGNQPSLKYRVLEKNEGISGNTNAAIEMADGDWIVFADHDDVLDLSAAYEIVRKINENGLTDAVYTDEDKITGEGHFLFGPHFKPDFNPAYLLTNNYICHLFAVRKTVLDETGLLQSGFDGAQDYDLVLRVSEKARLIAHVPMALYHWRSHGGSTASNPESKLYAFESGRRAVEAHLGRKGLDAQCELTEQYGHYRVRYKRQTSPFVSVLMPNRDHADLLRRAAGTLLYGTAYDNFELLILENGSTEPETEALYEELLSAYPDKVRVLRWEKSFNYAAINNWGAAQARGEYLLFLNNDIEITDADWMDALLAHCERAENGVAGAFLTYPDGSIQHCGVILGLGGAAGHMFGGMPADTTAGSGRAQATQNLSAVTAACMMTRKSVFDEVRGFDERFTVAYNDVDYCLKLRDRGLLVVMCAEAKLIHDESATRGYDVVKEDNSSENQEKAERLAAEAALLKAKWPAYFEKGDPYYNPNLSVTRPDFSLRS
ncbi:MAG: glycosyltransferase family 2 protein [Lachnospiraceae bacterium]|nr:glycosyltransferase family 2 protein [Lachnospiraceae bacterium]